MGSVKPSVRVRSAGGAPASVLHSNGSNGVLAVAPPVSNGYADHLHEELAVFETEDFDAQTYVQSKCQSMSEKVLRLIITYARLWIFCYESWTLSVHGNFMAGCGTRITI